MRREENVIRWQYEEPGAWKGMQVPIQRRRADFSISLIPKEAASILDVGCGEGTVTNRMAVKFPFVVGTDLSAIALHRVNAYRVQGSVRHLPFRNASFDAVTVFEVLEHLPTSLLEDALSEIKKVARRWIVVSVPYRERLWKRMLRCKRCGTRFHAYGHLTSWSEKRLARLFAPEFELTQVAYLGEESALPNWVYLVNRWLGNVWGNNGHAVCPCCCERDYYVNDGNIFGYVLSRLIWRAERLPAFAKPIWMFGRYQRK